MSGFSTSTCLNAGHLAGWVLDPAGNPLGQPHTIALDLDGQPASARDGHLRAAAAEVVHLARLHGCRLTVVEDLDFADARQTGRETLGRGERGKRLRRVVAGIPTRALRELLAGMAANADLWVVAVDPAWTSVWGGRYWQGWLDRATKASVTVSRHDAAPEDRHRRAADSAGRPETSSAALPVLEVVPKSAAQGPGVQEDSGQGRKPTRPVRPNRTPPGARRHRTVRCRRSVRVPTRYLHKERYRYRSGAWRGHGRRQRWAPGSPRRFGSRVLPVASGRRRLVPVAQPACRCLAPASDDVVGDRAA